MKHSVNIVTLLSLSLYYKFILHMFYGVFFLYYLAAIETELS